MDVNKDIRERESNKNIQKQREIDMYIAMEIHRQTEREREVERSKDIFINM